MSRSDGCLAAYILILIVFLTIWFLAGGQGV